MIEKDAAISLECNATVKIGLLDWLQRLENTGATIDSTQCLTGFGFIRGHVNDEESRRLEMMTLKYKLTLGKDTH